MIRGDGSRSRRFSILGIRWVMNFRQLWIKNGEPMFFRESQNEIMYITSTRPYTTQNNVAIRDVMRYAPGTKIEVFDFIVRNIINLRMNLIVQNGSYRLTDEEFAR